MVSTGTSRQDSLEVTSMRSSTPLRATLALVAATLLVAGAAQAADATRHGGPQHRAWESRLQQRLGLTEQQTEALRQIREREAAAMKQHAQSLRQAQSELRRLVLTEADEGAIQAKQAEVQRLLADSVQRRVDHLKELTPILTSQQREQLAELMNQPRRFHRGHQRQQQS
jgi:Spy/CpxP family protein refolding chaperone